MASRLACDTLVATMRGAKTADRAGEAATLRRAVEASDRAVVEAGRRDRNLRGMGTTLSAFWLPNPEAAGRAWIAHVGDSRIYVLRAAGLQQVSLDHSVAMGWVRDGFMTLEEAKRSPYWHYLSQSLGGVEPVRPQTEEIGLADATALLLCSDGLSNMVADDAIETIPSTHTGDAAAAAEALVETALENGGEDNVTVVAIARTDETAR